MNYLIIVRGLPGSGKTTFAELMCDVLSPVYSADDYWDDYNREWDGDELCWAHKYCFDRTETAMVNETRKIFVANTFVKDRDIKEYIDLAEKYNYMVMSIVVENRHGNKSVHDVPEKTVDSMERKFVIKLK